MWQCVKQEKFRFVLFPDRWCVRRFAFYFPVRVETVLALLFSSFATSGKYERTAKQLKRKETRRRQPPSPERPRNRCEEKRTINGGEKRKQASKGQPVKSKQAFVDGIKSDNQVL